MEGIVSLVDPFSILHVLDGRVSLANLIEFSHFVDLFVLEDNVYFDEVDLEHFFSAFASPQSPLRSLDSNHSALANAVSEVSIRTNHIYSAAPTNYTFSMESYEYWTTLSAETKQSLQKGEVLHSTTKSGYDRQDLLIFSHDLQTNIEIALEELAKTSLTIMPSARNLLPFLDVFHQMDTPALLIYNRIAAEHRKAVEQLLTLVRPRSVYLPPLLTILLSRSSNRSELPNRLIDLRDEFTEFRLSINGWFKELDQSVSLKDKIEIRNELDDAILGLMKEYEYKREGFYKQIAGAFVDAAAEGDVKKMLIKPAFAVLKEGLTTVLPNALSVRRFTGLVDLMDQALAVESYSNLLAKVFGSSLDISQKEITEAKRYKHYVQSKYDIGLPSPS